MDKKHKIAMIILVIAIGAGSFFGGMKYDQSQRVSQFATRGPGQGPGRSGIATERGAGTDRTPNGGFGDFAGGQVTAKDDSSVTIKARSGSSRIVFFSGSTAVDRSEPGSASDLAVGQQVRVSGKNNPDGSITATSIQINSDFSRDQDPSQ
ncbi:MAG TPA: DUF5666 domain-containing protein [Candidatus Fimivivens sp.]|nr:DUF5666 domain-containing protein [Candidatus Fimivivens sp.]